MTSPERVREGLQQARAALDCASPGLSGRLADPTPEALIRSALAALDGGVVRLGHLRELLGLALASLMAGKGQR